MTVIILERVPENVRGELTRWLLELHSGVFVGRISALVRDVLWDYICQHMGDGAGWLMYQQNNEQGFGLKTWHDTKRQLVDMEGLLLVMIPNQVVDTSRRLQV